MNEQAERIALELTEARAETLRLFDLAEESVLHRSPADHQRRPNAPTSTRASLRLGGRPSSPSRLTGGCDEG